MKKEITLADVQAAAKKQAAQVRIHLENLASEYKPKDRRYPKILSGRLSEDIANRLDRWIVMAQIFDAIASEEGGYICALEGIEGYAYAYVSVHQLACTGFSFSLAEMYDRSVFTSLPTLEVGGKKVLLLHQDSRTGAPFKGLEIGACITDYHYSFWEDDHLREFVAQAKRIL